MSEEAVTNSTCLIALERIGKLNLLSQVFTTVFVPPAVQAEFGIPVDWLTVKNIQNPAVIAALKTQLDEGEAEAIALAMELGKVFVILDDKKARRVAQQMGLKVIGTIGMLLRAKRKGLITDLEPLLTSLMQAGFHMTDTIRREALRLSVEDNPSMHPENLGYIYTLPIENKADLKIFLEKILLEGTYVISYQLNDIRFYDWTQKETGAYILEKGRAFCPAYEVRWQPNRRGYDVTLLTDPRTAIPEALRSYSWKKWDKDFELVETLETKEEAQGLNLYLWGSWKKDWNAW
ncbi:MAG: DUF3368 domain-containing protein, partial [Nitrospira sp.]|nr:DUF3368 domain-containing protein [Nitrospira sp.]